MIIHHDGYQFNIHTDAFIRNERIIGTYVDRSGKEQRITSESTYGYIIRQKLVEGFERSKVGEEL